MKRSGGRRTFGSAGILDEARAASPHRDSVRYLQDSNPTGLTVNVRYCLVGV